MNKLNNHQPILAFGDSLTFGYGAPVDKSYPKVLSQLLGVPIINAGINGELSEDGLKRLAILLDKHQPQMLLLCHGANDMLQKRCMHEMKKNLIEMIRLAKQRTIKVLLIAVPNTHLALTPIEQYQQVSESENVSINNSLLADILKHPTLHIDDIHPNALGYQKMAEVIYQNLLSLSEC